ncbi:hypothetical protein CG736_03430 [Kitasatospora sp. CB02891]|nr:hypothetical protein CG736_03430 [Kitasatospora sp. CB02891]
MPQDRAVMPLTSSDEQRQWLLSLLDCAVCRLSTAAGSTPVDGPASAQRQQRFKPGPLVVRQIPTSRDRRSVTTEIDFRDTP